MIFGDFSSEGKSGRHFLLVGGFLGGVGYPRGAARRGSARNPRRSRSFLRPFVSSEAQRLEVTIDPEKN